MRNYPPAVLEAYDRGGVSYRGMIRFDLGEGAFGFILQNEPYTHEGLVYQPLPAGILSVTTARHAAGTVAEGFNVVLSESPDDSITPDVIRQIELFDYRDRPVSLFDLHYDAQTNAVIDVVLIERGYINALSHERSETSGYTVTAECETRAIDFTRRNGRQRSHDDQQRRAPGDNFYTHTASAGRRTIRFT